MTTSTPYRFARWMLHLLYPRYDLETNPHNEMLLLRYAFMQKILGFNRHVPWPVHWSSQIKAPEKIQPGSRTPGLGIGCYIDGRNGIVLEENVWIGPHVSLISMNHDLEDYNRYIQAEPIVIRRDSWLAANCVILPGVELGPHTVVAAGAIVTRSFPEGNLVLGGNPAKVIKTLAPYGGSHS